jgi:hypothetical protein
VPENRHTRTRREQAGAVADETAAVTAQPHP